MGAEVQLLGEGGDFGAVLATGDLDGDGVADLVVAAPDLGMVYVYLAPSGSTEVADWTLDVGDTIGSLAIGDVSSSGGNELVVGLPEANGGDGEVQVFDMGGGAIATITLAGSGGALGTSVSVADFDDEDTTTSAPFDDLSIGAPNTAPGSAWLVPGPIDANVDLSGTDTHTPPPFGSVAGFVGDETSDHFGYKVLSAGFYGGIPSMKDLLVSAPVANTTYVLYDVALYGTP